MDRTPTWGKMLIPSLRLSREDWIGKPYSMDLRERVAAPATPTLHQAGKQVLGTPAFIQRVVPGCGSFVGQQSLCKGKCYPLASSGVSLV